MSISHTKKRGDFDKVEISFLELIEKKSATIIKAFLRFYSTHFFGFSIWARHFN